MKIHELQPAVNSKKSVKRLGRGIGSGHGKTSCKGHKGQWARAGGGVRVGFEGGQKSLLRRLPKRGFENNWRKVYSIINIGDLEEKFSDGDVVNATSLLERGVLSKVEHFGIKVLGDGKLTKKVTVEAAKFTASAKEALEKLGCTVKVIDLSKA